MSTDRLTGELAIEASDLVKTYPGDVRALDGVSFAVEAGTVFGLLGPNGAGKSTTVKILTTLSRPDSGQARVAGIDVLRQPDRVRQSIGCVAQKSGVDPQATGRENLTLQGQLYGLGGRELKRRVAELLDRFGLAEAADRQARTYSGGMQRKLDVALGFVHRPRALFLDEPTTGLDPEARADMWEEISRLAGANGDGRARAAVSRLEGVNEVQSDGGRLRARVASGATAVPMVIAALESEGIGVAAVTIARPSLDDVYLRYAGRAFGEAEQAVLAEGGAR